MSFTSGKFAGRIALVTGGNSGIGLATAKRFAAEGAYVFITGRRRDSLAEAAKAIGENSVTAVQGDVSRLGDLERLFATIEAEKGHLDIVFANAGGGTLSPLGQITEDQFDDTFNTNVKGVIFTVQNALPLLREGSSIILNASTTSIKGTAAFSVYSASKAAVRNLARSWIVDLKGRNIRVNVISPGVVPTPGYDGLGLSKEQIQGFVDAQVGTIPAGRVGTTDEIAKAVSFLASDDSSFVNGVELFVDGGMTQNLMVVIDAGESLVIERRSRHAFAETESLPSRSIGALRANPKGGTVLMNAHPLMAPEPPLKLAHAPASEFAMRYQAADTTQLIGAMDLPLECLSKSVL